MIEILYFVGFWFFALLYIVVKSIKSDEITLNSDIFNKFTQYSTIIKVFPTGLAILFIFYLGHDSVYLSLILGLGIFFCMLGDMGMERGLIPGLPIFLVAQIILMVTFIGEAVDIGITAESLFLTEIVAVGTIIYIILFLRYLETSDKGLGKFRLPVLIYCIFISGMLSSTVLLWINSGVLEFVLVILGALLFVISDSTIAVREFHHDFSYREIKVMSTYYAAIFLLSLSPVVIPL
ncbi:MAG: lysoplasmalogenase [Candidatus Hodarchaeales archaeon]|jgi:uncharacterized membrane protein YhhN